jgi:NAD-dependent deacetylase
VTEQLHQVTSIIASAHNLVAFTGSGISAESGIPTFRDPGGLWDRYDPATFGTDGVATLGKITEAGRAFLQEMVDTLERARPNPGHLALAELERMGILSTVITQNIDDLHCEAGNTRVIEVHGNMYRLKCLTCGRTFKLKKGEDLPAMVKQLDDVKKRESLDITQLMPKCQCGGLTRFDVVHFGEPVQDFPRAEQAASSCDVMLALGTSGVVTPAALLPGYAKGAGARVIEVNATGSYFSSIDDFAIVEKTGDALPRIVAAVREILG